LDHGVCMKMLVIHSWHEDCKHTCQFDGTGRIKTIQWSTSVKSRGARRRLDMWRTKWLHQCRSSLEGARVEAGHVAKAGGIGGFRPKPPQDLVSRYSQKPRAEASRRRTCGGIMKIAPVSKLVAKHDRSIGNHVSFRFCPYGPFSSMFMSRGMMVKWRCGYK